MPRRYSGVRLDPSGMKHILERQPEVVAEIRRLTDEIVAAVEAHPSVQRHSMPVEADFGTTDRTKGYVTIAHPGGLGVQAKYGALTRAASSAGIEVKRQ